MLGLMKTCRKHGLSIFVYIGGRLGLNLSTERIPSLARLVDGHAV